MYDGLLLCEDGRWTEDLRCFELTEISCSRYSDGNIAAECVSLLKHVVLILIGSIRGFLKPQPSGDQGTVGQCVKIDYESKYLR